MATMSDIRREVKKGYRMHGNWRAVGEAFGISGGMAFRIVNEGYEPKDPHIRVKLGLPAMAPAPVCPTCGVVHVSRVCPVQRAAAKRYGQLFDYPVKTLRRMFDEREEF